MNLALAPYLFFLSLSVTVCLFLAFYAWRRRHVRTAAVFSLLTLSAGWWAFFYGFELLATTFSAKLFWFNLKQIGASILWPGILILAIQFTHVRIRHFKLLLAVLLVEPIGTQLVFWTNSLHGWAGTSFLVTDSFPFALLHFEYSPWFWFHIFAGQLLLTTATLILAARLPGAEKIYRRQLTMLLLGLLIPWLVGSLSTLGFYNWHLFDATTFFFPISAVFIGLGLFRHQLWQLTPVAYSAVFSSIRDGIVVLDDDGRILKLNPTAEDILGLAETECYGQHISQILPLPEQDLLTDASQKMELLLEREGNGRYLEIYSTKIASDIYTSTGHLLILYDVTDQKEAEKARQSSEERYRTIFETDSAATLILEEDMTISLANDRFAALVGYSRQEIEGKMKWTRFVHEADLLHMTAYHRARRQQGSSVPSEYEFRLLTREGDVKNAYVSVALIPGSATSVASLLDITERKLAEQLLQQRATDLEAAVRSEQERSAIILESVSDAIAVSNLENKIVYVNPAFTHLTGYTMDELLGQLPTSILNGRLPQPLWNSLQRALLHRTVWEGEIQIRRKNGTVYDANVLVAPMYDGNGKLIGHVSSHRDITPTKRVEESRRSFITNISHELRTPVTNIKLYTDLLHRHFSTDRREQYFEVLASQIERLENLIQSTIEIVDLENETKVLTRERVQWETLFESLRLRVQTKAIAQNVSLKFESSIVQLPAVLGDTRLLSRALYELIQNALNFTPAEGQVTVSGMITRQEQDNPNWLTISVCDDGPGIDAAEQKYIFDRFFRGNRAATGHIPGTGLGLSMVKLIAEAHNGRITLTSTPGQGSTFTLWLPLT